MPSLGHAPESFDPRRVQAYWVSGCLTPAQLVSFSEEALLRGFDGGALQYIAGLTDPTCAELRNWPERLFTELSLPSLTRDAALELVVHDYSSDVSPVMAVVLAAFPAFSPRWKEHVSSWEGRRAGDYNDLAVFVSYVVEDLHAGGACSEVARAFGLMEQLLNENGQQKSVVELIGLGFFESLQNVMSWRSEGASALMPFLGVKSRQLWMEIEQAWSGRSSLSEVVRAERAR